MKYTSTFILFIVVFFTIENGCCQDTDVSSVENSTYKDYYFQLEEFVEPKIYLFYTTTNPHFSQYWKISAVPDSHFLITEAYSVDFRKLEFFKEKYDSVGSKVVEYLVFHKADTTVYTIGASEVYRWKSLEAYTYDVFDTSPANKKSYSKVRKFASLDTIEVLRYRSEVMRFKDDYIFYFDGEKVFSRVQQSFYSKEYGLVRFLRFDEKFRTNETYILREILDEEQWLDLQH